MSSANDDRGLFVRASSHAWTPLTDAACDTGAIGASRDQVLVGWSMEEDERERVPE